LFIAKRGENFDILLCAKRGENFEILHGAKRTEILEILLCAKRGENFAVFEFELLSSRINFCWFEFEWLGCVPFNFSGCSNSNAAWASELILLNFGIRIRIRQNFELEESRI